MDQHTRALLAADLSKRELKIILFLAASGGTVSATLTEIGDATGLNLAACSRTITTLRERGITERSGREIRLVGPFEKLSKRQRRVVKTTNPTLGFAEMTTYNFGRRLGEFSGASELYACDRGGMFVEMTNSESYPQGVDIYSSSLPSGLKRGEDLPRDPESARESLSLLPSDSEESYPEIVRALWEKKLQPESDVGLKWCKDRETFFDEFWSLYPKKAEKVKARAKWRSRGMDRFAGAILADLKSRVKSERTWSEVRADKSKAHFLPNPARYLTNALWLDETRIYVDGSNNGTPSWVDDYAPPGGWQ